jgi:signal transduction histidine kinase
VEFNASDLIRASARPVRRALPLELTEAVASAVGEALTNTAKHAGVSTAVLRATLTDRALTVSLLDRGAGFDPTAATTGVGLRESITARIEEVGGRVRIESAPGEGTYVELVVQLPDPPSPNRTAQRRTT